MGGFLAGGDPQTVYYTSPSGTGIGTRDNPMSLSSALLTGQDVRMLDGVYTKDIIDIPDYSKLRADVGARPIIMRSDGYPPAVNVGASCVVGGVWFGGMRYTSEGTPVIQVQHDATIQNCTFFGYYQGISEGAGYNNTYQYNRFVSCGGGGLYHDIYISSDSHANILDNIFLGGEGYKIHLWHAAANATVTGNFCAECYYELVTQHQTNVVQDNVFWNHTAPTQAWLTVNLSAGLFTHNLFGRRTFGTGKWDTQMNGGADDLGLTVDRCGLIGDRYQDTTTWPGYTVNVGPYNGEGHVLPAPGTNYTHYAVTDLPALLGYSEAEIDTAVSNLITKFGQTTQQIHDDAEIETYFATLKAVIDAWKLA